LAGGTRAGGKIGKTLKERNNQTSSERNHLQVFQELLGRENMRISKTPERREKGGGSRRGGKARCQRIGKILMQARILNDALNFIAAWRVAARRNSEN